MITNRGTYTKGTKVNFKDTRSPHLIGTGVIIKCDNDFTCGLTGVLYDVEVVTCKDDWLDAGETIYLLHSEIKGETDDASARL